MSKPIQGKSSVISKYLNEMIQSTDSLKPIKRKTSPEKIQNPPRPISPPRIFFDPEPGKIISRPVPNARPVCVYSLFQSKSFKVVNLDNYLTDITNFIQGQSRSKWLSAINFICKQASIPLIKEILYNHSKTVEAKKNFRKKLKEYLAKRHKENKSHSPVRPPFLASSKISIDNSKHVACINAKEENQKKELNNLEEAKCKVLVDLNKVNFELIRTVFLILQLDVNLRKIRKEYIENGLTLRNIANREKLFNAWKEFTSKRSEKKEVYKLLRNSMEHWKKSRIFLAFKDLKTYKLRKYIKSCHDKAFLNFKIKKRLLHFWKLRNLKKITKIIEKTVTKFYMDSRITMIIFALMQRNYDFKKLLINKKRLIAETRRKFSEWYEKKQIILNIKNEYFEFNRNPLTINKYLKELTKSLGEYRGLLQLNRKSLCLNALVKNSTVQNKELSLKYNNSMKITKNQTIDTNMFTLSVSNLKSPESTQENNIGSPEKLQYSEKKIEKSKVFDTSIKINDMHNSGGFKNNLNWQEQKIKNHLEQKLDYEKVKNQNKNGNNEKNKDYSEAQYEINLPKAIKDELNSQKSLQSKGLNKNQKYFEARLFNSQKLFQKSFQCWKKFYNFSMASLIFRLKSLKKYGITVWQSKLKQKILIRRVFSVALGLWKERIESEFRSDSHMLAEIIKAWRYRCEQKGNTKKFKIKWIMAENFFKTKSKISKFFKWKNIYTRNKAVRNIANVFSRILRFFMGKKFQIWKKIKKEIKIIEIKEETKEKKGKIEQKGKIDKKQKNLKEDKNKKYDSKIKNKRTKKETVKEKFNPIEFYFRKLQSKMFYSWLRETKQNLMKFDSNQEKKIISPNPQNSDSLANKFYNTLLKKKTFFGLIVLVI